jgi:hypothetical protein
LFFLPDKAFSQYFCGTTNPPDDGTRSASDCEYDNDDGVYYLPIVFHNYSSRELSAIMVQDIVTDMTTYFTGHPQKIIPILAKYNITGDCFNGIFDYTSVVHISNISYQNLYSKIETELFPNNSFQSFQDRYVNIFIFESFSNDPDVLAFVSPFNTSRKFIMVSNATTSDMSVLDLGMLLAHELGHFLHLLHPHGDTHGTGCNDDPCTGQDMVLDTPVGPNVSELLTSLGCGTQTHFCNNNFNQSNLMTYGLFPSDGCTNHFLTSGQMNRMSVSLNTVHSHLFSSTNLLRTIGLNPQTITSDIVYNNVTLNNQTFDVLDNVNIEIQGNVTLNNCVFNMGSKTKIEVSNGARLRTNNTHFSSICNSSVWDGIYVESSGVVITENNSKIDGAKTGIFAEHGSQVFALQSEFRDCTIGIQLGGDEGSGVINNWIVNCKFLSGVFGNAGPKMSFPKMKFGIKATRCESLYVYYNNQFSKNEVAVFSLDNINYVYQNTTTECEKGFDINNRISKKYSFVGFNTLTNLNCGSLPNCKWPGIKIHGGAVSIINNSIAANIGMELIAVTKELQSDISMQIASNTFKRCEKRALELKASNDLTLYLNTDNNQDSKEIFLGDNNFIDLQLNYFSVENAKINFFRRGSLNNNLFTSLQFTGANSNNYLYENLIYGSSTISSSPVNTYQCNVFGDPATFRFNNLGTTLTANSFSTEFNITGATTQISPQINRGNDFTDVTANYSASDLVLENNIFVVKNAALYKPSSINGPTGWFLDNGAENQPNCESNPSFDSPWEADQFAKCVDSLFQGTKYARFSTQQKWSILLTLYRIYKLRGEQFPFNLSACAVRILQDYGQHVVGKIDRLYEKVDSLRGLRVEGPASDSIRAMQETVIDMMKNHEDPDSIALLSVQINNHANARQQEWNVYNSGYQALKNGILQTAAQVENETTIEPFLYLAQLIPSLVAYYEGDTAHFDTQKLDYLEDIILECDTIAGEASYIAAFLYEAVTSHDISQYMDCQQNPLPRTTKFASDIKVYPNPTSDKLIIDGMEEANVNICNISGNIVGEYHIKGKTEIDVSSLTSGVYIIRVNIKIDHTVVRRFVKL